VVVVIALVNAHNGNGCGQRSHQGGVYNTQGDFAATVAQAAPVLLATYGIFV